MAKVTVDGNEEGLLIVGGFEPRNGITEYHGKNGSWIQLASLPVNISSAQMAWNSDTNMMYHFGGFSDGEDPLTDGFFKIFRFAILF